MTEAREKAAESFSTTFGDPAREDIVNDSVVATNTSITPATVTVSYKEDLHAASLVWLNRALDAGDKLSGLCTESQVRAYKARIDGFLALHNTLRELASCAARRPTDQI